MKTLATIFGFILLISCSSTKETTETKQETAPTKNWVEEGYVKASVKDYSSLDGCGFFLVKDDDSQELMPVDLPAEFRIDQQKVWLKYHQTKPMHSTCMKGIPVSVDDIKKR